MHPFNWIFCSLSNAQLEKLDWSKAGTFRYFAWKAFYCFLASMMSFTCFNIGNRFNFWDPGSIIFLPCLFFLFLSHMRRGERGAVPGRSNFRRKSYRSIQGSLKSYRSIQGSPTPLISDTLWGDESEALAYILGWVKHSIKLKHPTHDFKVSLELS